MAENETAPVTVVGEAAAEVPSAVLAPYSKVGVPDADDMLVVPLKVMFPPLHDT